MSPPPIPRMSKNEARGNQRQSRIRGNQFLVIQRPSETIRCNQAAPQVQSDAIRRNQTQSDAISMPGALLFSVFSCFGRAARACVLCFVFWAGTTGLCVLLLFLAGTTAQRACVLCFRVLADPPQNTARGQETHQKERRKSWAFLLTVKRDTQKERATKSKV